MNKQELIKLLEASKNDCPAEELSIGGQAFNNAIEIAVMYAKQLDEPNTKDREFINGLLKRVTDLERQAEDAANCMNDGNIGKLMEIGQSASYSIIRQFIEIYLESEKDNHNED